MMKTLISAVMLFLLFCAALSDMKSGEVSDALTIPFATLGICVSVFSGRNISALVAAVLVCTALADMKWTKKLIGGADLLIYAGLIGFYGVKNIAVLLFVPSAVALAIIGIERHIIKQNIMTKDGGMTFIPAVLLSVLFWTVLI